MKQFNIAILRKGFLWVGALVVALPVMADDIQMVTYFPVPYAAYNNVYVQRSSDSSGATPTFTISGANGTEFELHLNGTSTDGTSLRADAATLGVSDVGSQGGTLNFAADVFTNIATFGNVGATPVRNDLQFQNLRIDRIDGQPKSITATNLITTAPDLLPECQCNGAPGEWQWRDLVVKVGTFKTQTRKYLTCVDPSENPTLYATHEWTNVWENLPQQHCTLNSESAVNAYCGQMGNSTLDLVDVLRNSTCNGTNGSSVYIFAYTDDFWAVNCKDISPENCGDASKNSGKYCFVFNMEKDILPCEGDNHPTYAAGDWGKLEWDTSKRVSNSQRQWTSTIKSVGPVCLFRSTEIKN